MKPYTAHIRQSDHNYQNVQTHLNNVALLARSYGDDIKLGAHAELAGLLHDIGKFTTAFETYIQNAVLHNRITDRLDHATAGAKYLHERFHGKDAVSNMTVETISMAVLSHHTSIQNFTQPDQATSDYDRRIRHTDLPHYSEAVTQFEGRSDNRQRVEMLFHEAKDELSAFLQSMKHIPDIHLSEANIYTNYMQKMILSCLIDADREDTRRFEEDDTQQTRSNYHDVFKKGYDNIIKQMQKQTDQTPVNRLRHHIAEDCDAKADKPSSIYQLAAPTGSGKTLATLRYALKHALSYNKQRIIYVVPYTTILEQNAAAVRKAIHQHDAVLEHHGSVINNDTTDNEPDYYQKASHKALQLGRDNWDYPVIMMTSVQFLDAFFQKGTRKTRRLHHLTNSVIVFDEVQAIPHKHFTLFNTAVNYLHYLGGSSVILCTATQPSVSTMSYHIHLPAHTSMTSHKTNHMPDLNRTALIDKTNAGGWSKNQIASFSREIMQTAQSLLIILNTKRDVQTLYQHLVHAPNINVYHLSTTMCPAHRTDTLNAVRNDLDQSQPVICVSTSVIESGVDISFESVIRSVAGLDAIAQASGRCNRNNEYTKGNVYIIKSADENLTYLPEVRIGAGITQQYILNNPAYQGHYLSGNAIETYFQHFNAASKREVQQNMNTLDYPLIYYLDGRHPAASTVSTASRGMYKTVETHFEAIEAPTQRVIVPYQKGRDIIRTWQDNKSVTQTSRQIQKAQIYAINLYEHEIKRLRKNSLITSSDDGSVLYLDDKAYNPAYGVITIQDQKGAEKHDAKSN